MDTEEAIRRVRQIVPMLRVDVTTAIRSHAVLEAANDMVARRELAGVNTEFALTFNTMRNALGLKVALDLARIFDLSENRSPEKQDKASVPVLAALLARPDVKLGLERDAEGWSAVGRDDDDEGSEQSVVEAMLNESNRPDNSDCCRDAIAAFLEAAALVDVDSSAEKSGLARLRQFRTQRLAHSLFDQEPEQPPNYVDVLLLLIVAKQAATYALLAVEGWNQGFDDQAQFDRENADGFCRCVLDGLKRAGA